MYLLSPLLFNIVLKVLATAFKKEKEINSIQVRKKEVKLSLFAKDMILCIENPKYFTEKLLELVNEFSNVAQYKINMQKSIMFLYTNNELSEREIKKAIPLTIASKPTEYLGTNLPTEVKDLYTENYTVLMRILVQDGDDRELTSSRGHTESTAMYGKLPLKKALKTGRANLHTGQTRGKPH